MVLIRPGPWSNCGLPRGLSLTRLLVDVGIPRLTSHPHKPLRSFAASISPLSDRSRQQREGFGVVI